MRLIAISSYLPFPIDQGDPVRVSMFLRSLARTAILEVLVVRRPDSTDSDVSELANMICPASLKVFDHRAIEVGRLGVLRRLVRAIMTSTPSWIANRFSGELLDAARASAEEVDGVILLGEAAGAYGPLLRRSSPQLVVHWDKSNVLSASTKDDLRAADGRLSQLAMATKSHIAKRFERRVLRAIDQVSVTSSMEAQRLVGELGRSPDFVIPSTVVLHSTQRPLRPEAGGVVWLGSLTYAPNVDGLLRFLTEGEPILRAHGLRLLVAGSGDAPNEILESKSVTHLGFVEDLTQLVDVARAAIVPLWRGAGVKLKTLTLMTIGLPVAATQTAMEGIPHEAALAVASRPETLASAIVAASASDLAAARSRANRVLRHSFSTEAFAENVAEVVRSLAAQGTDSAELDFASAP